MTSGSADQIVGKEEQTILDQRLARPRTNFFSKSVVNVLETDRTAHNWVFFSGFCVKQINNLLKKLCGTFGGSVLFINVG